MLIFLTMMIILIAVASSVGYSIISMTQDVQKINSAQSDKNLLSQWEIVIGNNLKSFTDERIIAAPLGRDVMFENGSSYHTLPAGMGVTNINAFGRPLIYCPFSDKQIPSDHPKLAKIPGISNSYMVGTERGFDGNEYVLYADQKLDASVLYRGVVAFIISPMSRNGIVSGCEDVRYEAAAGRYFIPGGNVKAILKQTARLNEDRKVVMNAVGDDASDLGRIVQSWDATKPNDFVIALDKDKSDYQINSDLALSGSYAEHKRVEVSSLGGASYIDSPKPIKLEFNNIDVTLKNITFGGNIGVVVKGGSLTLSNARLSGLSVTDSSLRFEGNSYFNKPSSNLELPVIVNDSDIYQNGVDVYIETNAMGGLLLNGSRWSLSKASASFVSQTKMKNAIQVLRGSDVLSDGADLGFQSVSNSVDAGDSLFIIDDSSRAVLDRSLISVADASDSLFFNKGSLYLNETDINFDSSVGAAVVMGIGSSATISGTEIGGNTNKPAYGVLDKGARFVGGSNTNIYSSLSCWSGDVFESAETSSGSSSIANTDFNKAFNKSNWSCHK